MTETLQESYQIMFTINAKKYYFCYTNILEEK